ncbi:MAG: hypothetical protein NT151_09865 [Acidobacteria bacterium]|nr:hypothetical protein [Acidobacteriota bacterium]
MARTNIHLNRWIERKAPSKADRPEAPAKAKPAPAPLKADDAHSKV